MKCSKLPRTGAGYTTLPFQIIGQGVIELKNPGTESATLTGAYNQLQTYKSQIPSLFRTNAALVTSDGLIARIGSLTANEERFMP